MAGHYTLRQGDVGKMTIACFGRRWSTNFMGRVQPGDVGKRVYVVQCDDGLQSILQVENDSQRDERLAKKGGAW